MSSKETDGNKTADDRRTGFKTAAELDAVGVGSRDVQVIGTTRADLTAATIQVDDERGGRRFIFDEDEARYVRDQLTEILERGSSE